MLAVPGERDKLVRTGVVTTTVLVSACPPAARPMTWNVPGLAPAVNSPLGLIVPPPALQVTAGVVVLPSLQSAVALNWRSSPAPNDTLDGLTWRAVRVATGVATTTAAVSAIDSPGEVTTTE